MWAGEDPPPGGPETDREMPGRTGLSTSTETCWVRLALGCSLESRALLAWSLVRPLPLAPSCANSHEVECSAVSSFLLAQFESGCSGQRARVRPRRAPYCQTVQVSRAP